RGVSAGGDSSWHERGVGRSPARALGGRAVSGFRRAVAAAGLHLSLVRRAGARAVAGRNVNPRRAMRRNCARLAAVVLGVARLAAAAPEPAVIPVGLDAYRLWERWPEQRIGVRAYMRSTYDRQGGNERADASHYLYQLAGDKNVTLDVAGPGVLYFARYNHWHGSPWHYEVDGIDHIVAES